MDGDPRFWLQFQVISDGLERHEPVHATDKAPDRFSCFPDLPPEIRLQIWSLLIQPRIVLVTCVDAADPSPARAHLASRPRRPPVPALLHASHEARSLALRHYELAFPWRVPRTLADAWATASARDLWEERRILQQRGREGGPARAQQPARVWFNFAADALLLAGELEPRDPDGFPTPACYFLRRGDAARVRHVGCAFESLPCAQFQDELVFGALFHVVDRFFPREEVGEVKGAPPRRKRLLVTVREQTRREDEDRDGYDPFNADTMPSKTRRRIPEVLPSRENLVAKVWRQWMSGTHLMTLERKETEMVMVEEEKLADFIAEQELTEGPEERMVTQR
ncbi:hypothetical protein NKR23_g11324 [Pleurostoma richardsiae]|uniref:2EXR domain-containing protein n=1 Tax=Pleurostoma richardsiae TaxID=41990 RepID=A0AA38RC62_9PEZI|nr:hypothetical protein NKR23_g11324 [Pleurostoma richardsiae]